MIPQIDPGIHSQKSQRPRNKPHNPFLSSASQPNPLVGQESEVDGKEEHVLGMRRRPAVGVAHLEDGACLWAFLLDGGFDELVDELGEDEAGGEEHALELTAEEEVAGETAEGDEDWDQGDPCQEVPYLVAFLVTDVG